MAWPPQSEIATLTVNGMDFSDWETVMVRRAMREQPPFTCRFTCSEGLPLSKNFAVMQIRPGMICSITLAGFPAFKGKVITRQVYYDAKRHHIEIQCGTYVDIATTAVVSQTMEWRNKTFAQIAQNVLDQLGLKLVFEGGAPPSYKFDRVSATPGESPHDFLDMLARGLSQATGIGISFTSNYNGDFVVAMGPNGGNDEVVEGQNILIGREIIYNPAMAGNAAVIAQAPGSDQHHMAEVAHSPFFAQAFESFGKLGVGGVILNKLPTFDTAIMKGRALSEQLWQQGDEITVFATVYGWLRPTGGLWDRNQNVSVTSPMLIMNNQILIAKSVTFTQGDGTGTRTTLELCNPAALHGINPDIQYSADTAYNPDISVTGSA